jgi:hypothetical protein
MSKTKSSIRDRVNKTMDSFRDGVDKTTLFHGQCKQYNVIVRNSVHKTKSSLRDTIKKLGTVFARSCTSTHSLTVLARHCTGTGHRMRKIVQASTIAKVQGERQTMHILGFYPFVQNNRSENYCNIHRYTLFNYRTSVFSTRASFALIFLTRASCDR